MSLQSQLTEAVQYHERITDIQEARDHIKEEIEKNVLNTIEQEENDQGDHPIEYVPVETVGAMKDFKDAENKFDCGDLVEMISELNHDQKQIFDKVTKSLTSNDNILRLYAHTAHSVARSLQEGSMGVAVECCLGADIGPFLEHSSHVAGGTLPLGTFLPAS